MSINDFERLIEAKIIDRGFHYYEQDQVEDLEQTDRGEFSAAVVGSERYSVYIRFNPQFDIVEHSCSCPYDWGDYCKHKVAVLYYIKDSEMYLQAPEKMGKISVIRKELTRYSREELESLLLDLAKRNRAFADELLGYFGFDEWER